MGWLTLCNDDPLVKTLSDVFRANIIRVPEQRMQPLRVLACKDGQLAYRGALSELLAGAPVSELISPALATSGMADISGRRSRKIKAELGLDILKGFLSGFGVPAALGVMEKFSGAAEVSFSFSEVERIYIDPSRLGQLLAGRQLDPRSPVVGDFIGNEAWQCLVIDSVITSKDFTISIDRQSSHDFKLDVPAIENLLSQANSNIQVNSASNASLTFKGPEARAFAFTCQSLIFDPSGNILQMPPSTALHTFRKAGTSPQVLISKQPCMLEVI